MFLLTDSQITNERFLIYINDLLASGNIPDLFAVDEVDTIVSGKHRAHGVFWMGSVVWCANDSRITYFILARSFIHSFHLVDTWSYRRTLILLVRLLGEQYDKQSQGRGPRSRSEELLGVLHQAHPEKPARCTGIFSSRRRLPQPREKIPCSRQLYRHW